MTVALDRIGVHSTIPIPRKLLQYVCRSFIFQVENGIFPPICCHRDCHNHGGRRNPGRSHASRTNHPSEETPRLDTVEVGVDVVDIRVNALLQRRHLAEMCFALLAGSHQKLCIAVRL